MLLPRVFVKNLRLTQRLIDDFLANALGAMMNASLARSHSTLRLCELFYSLSLVEAGGVYRAFTISINTPNEVHFQSIYYGLVMHLCLA